MKTVAAIGDLHGHAPALEALLRALERRGGFFQAPGKLAPDARLVLTGDYIDRGSSGLAVIERLRELQATNPGQVVTLLGNHELMALEALDEARALASVDPGTAFVVYRRTDHGGGNGGGAFVREFGDAAGNGAFATYARRMARDGDLGAWVRALVPLHVEEVGGRRILFSHADVPPMLLSAGGLERYGMDVSVRMEARTDGMGGASIKYGNEMFKSTAESLFWSRKFGGLATASPQAVARICEQAGVDLIVTGHTMHPGRIVSYGGRIFDIDVGMTPGYGENEPQALVVTEREVVALAASGRERALPSCISEIHPL